LALQLLQHLFYRNGPKDVFRRRRQDGQDGECAVFLVLFEPSSETTLPLAAFFAPVTRHILLLRDAVLAHALSSLRQLAQHVLPRHISGAEHPSPNGEVCAIPPQPLSRCLYHRGVVETAIPELELRGEAGSRVGRFGARARADVARHCWVDAMALRCAIITSISVFLPVPGSVPAVCDASIPPSRKLKGAGQGAS